MGLVGYRGCVVSRLVRSCCHHDPPVFHPEFSNAQPAISIALNHDRGTCAFAFGELASGSQADLQLLRFPADNWAIEVWLIESVLDAASTGTPAITRLKVNARTASLWRGARLHKGRSFYKS